ncbi:MAG: SIMPL domain-containing protein [Patescibacteria group bacterium]
MNELIKEWPVKWAFVALIIFLGVMSLGALMNLRYIGAGIAAANTISISGHGEALAVPDIATFSFSVVSDKATVAAAQADATQKANATTKYLTDAGVDKKDIQTSDYSIYPQYDYVQGVCQGGYCPGGRQVLRGYQVRQGTTVKVRETAKAGELLAGVGGKGATEVSGLQFTFDDPDKVATEARDKAIADAKEKAETLAKQLGVSLVRVVSFSESSGGSYPRPMTAAYSMGGAEDSKSVAPEISTGQNKVTNDVTVTYEIR